MQLSPGDKSSSVPAEQTDRSRDNAPSVRELDPIVVLQRNNRGGLIGGCLCRTSGHGVRTEVAAVTSRSHGDLGMCRPEGLRSFPWDKSAVMERSWLGNAWNCLEITSAPRNGDPKGLCRAGWGPWGHGSAGHCGASSWLDLMISQVFSGLNNLVAWEFPKQMSQVLFGCQA